MYICDVPVVAVCNRKLHNIRIPRIVNNVMNLPSPARDSYIFILFYYIDASVLLENIPLVKFIKTTSGPEWFIFHNLTREFIDDVILVISLYYFMDVFLSI